LRACSRRVLPKLRPQPKRLAARRRGACGRIAETSEVAMLMLRFSNSSAVPKPFAAAALGAALGAAAFGVLRRCFAWCAQCYARAEQRRHLAELDERMLKDVGISPSAAAHECAKPWWRT